MCFKGRICVKGAEEEFSAPKSKQNKQSIEKRRIPKGGYAAFVLMCRSADIAAFPPTIYSAVKLFSKESHYLTATAARPTDTPLPVAPL